MLDPFRLSCVVLFFALPEWALAEGAAPVAERIAARGYPSVFQAWNPAEVDGDEPRERTEARHDLLFHAADFFGLRWDSERAGLATRFTEASLAVGRERRRRLLALNPNLVLLCEIRYRDAHRSFLPADSPWWDRDGYGRPKAGWEEGGYLLLDSADGAYQDHVAERARAAVESGVFDGVMLDWWQEDDARVALAKKVREAIGADALILVNANDRTSPRTAAYINGHYMECYRSETRKDWERIEASLVWAEKNLRRPRINCLETWRSGARDDARRVRRTTTLGLTRSDGYVLFADPNSLPTPDHLHRWRPFWDAELGRPIAPGKLRDDGCVIRRFEHGWAVYNPTERAVDLAFSDPHRSVATGVVTRSQEVGPLDGDLFLATR